MNVFGFGWESQSGRWHHLHFWTWRQPNPWFHHLNHNQLGSPAESMEDLFEVVRNPCMTTQYVQTHILWNLNQSCSQVKFEMFQCSHSGGWDLDVWDLSCYACMFHPNKGLLYIKIKYLPTNFPCMSSTYWACVHGSSSHLGYNTCCCMTKMSTLQSSHPLNTQILY